MIVMKFGGTSVKDSLAMSATALIIKERLHRKPLVVLSACGGITDKLLRVARVSAKREAIETEHLLSEIEQHHRTLITTLVADSTSALAEVDELLASLREFNEGLMLLGECTPRSLDTIASFGERLSTTIMTHYLSSQGLHAWFLDARNVMITDDTYTHATVDRGELRHRAQQQILPQLDKEDVVVTQGFIGATQTGITTTLGRGGSDLSAALFGEALDAEEIQIWTDVSGVFSADPRKISTATTIERMSFDEVRELANYGAKVLHPDTIMPAVDRNIPVVVLNTFAPLDKGTTITARVGESARSISAVSARHDAILVRCVIAPDENPTTVLHTLVEYCMVMGKEVLHCIMGESVCCCVVQGNETALPLLPNHYDISKVSLVCVTGPHLKSDTHALEKVCSALATYQPIALAVGTSEVSVVAIIQQEHADRVLRGVHSLVERTEF